MSKTQPELGRGLRPGRMRRRFAVVEQKAVAEIREGFPEAGAAARLGVVGVLQMCFTERARAERFEGTGSFGLD